MCDSKQTNYTNLRILNSTFYQSIQRKKTMKNFNITALALALGLAFSMTATAESMSKEQYKLHEKNINAEYKSARVRCESLAGNAEDICDAEEKGKRNVSRAELEQNYTPTVKTRYNLHVAKAEADYAVAMQKCDDKGGNEADVCVKEAKANKVHAVADAQTEMSTSKVNAVAAEKSTEANEKAMEKSNDARKDATMEKRKADYAVAKEKCDALAGNAKDLCMSDAKMQFGK